MKKFEFPLRRVLELRRQQAEVERAKLQALRAELVRLESEIVTTQKRADAAREHVQRSPSTSGLDLLALANFQRHMGHVGSSMKGKREQVNTQISEQQTQVREAERKVKLLENLESRKLAEWTVGRDKELEELAADSYMARLIAGRRVDGYEDETP